MKTVQVVMWALAGIVLLSLVGCHERRVVVVREPGPPHSEYTVYREAPPPVRAERRPRPPSGRHVWIEGNWYWGGHRYVWQPGYWALPPDGAVWRPGRYDKHKHGYRRVRGRWDHPKR